MFSQRFLKKIFLVSVTVGLLAITSSSYGAEPSSRHHAYVHNGLGRSIDEGAKTALQEDIGAGSYPRMTPKLWSSSHDIGYTIDLNHFDRLGLQVGYHTYGIRQYQNPTDSYFLRTKFDLSYSGFSAMMVGSHLFSQEHRLSLGGGIQRSIVNLVYRTIDSTSESARLAISTRGTYNWQPKIQAGYQFFAKDNVSITLSFAHTWGDQLDSLANKVQENSPTLNATYVRAKRVPSMTTVLVGLTFYV
jgi:hypothetical protein